MLPVLVDDFRRLFNTRPDHYEASEVLGGGPGVESGAMNVVPVADKRFNGLAFRVTGRELELLDRRENAYQRLEVEARAFDSGEPIATGHVYSSRPDARWIEREPARLLPLWRDVVWARDAAYGTGRRFGETCDRRTYLADGKALVADRYRDHLG